MGINILRILFLISLNLFLFAMGINLHKLLPKGDSIWLDNIFETLNICIMLSLLLQSEELLLFGTRPWKHSVFLRHHFVTLVSGSLNNL